MPFVAVTALLSSNSFKYAWHYSTENHREIHTSLILSIVWVSQEIQNRIIPLTLERTT